MNEPRPAGPATGAPRTIADTVRAADVERMLDRYGFSAETREIIRAENLLPRGLLSRLQATYPQHSGLLETRPFLFPPGRDTYSGLGGFRDMVRILARNGIHLDHLPARELFIEVYRFKATRHILNTINWEQYERDPMYQLVVPQPGMMRPALVDAYVAAPTPEARQQLVDAYKRETNPHDGKQLLNKPWLETAEGELEVLDGSQHKYPPCQLIFDVTTQQCFAFCTYCFRHAQVRGDEDMFLQEDIDQVHRYLRAHPEVTDVLITGGDAGYLPVERLRAYAQPILDDPALTHVRTIRLGSRMLTYQPERVLARAYEPMLALFDELYDNGIQLTWMSHFSTPRELLNPVTLAAIRRLQRHHVDLRSQSPIMNHISLFFDAQGRVDVPRTAQNWIDLGNLLATLHIRFHSMYCPRPTGEHHYFAAPLAEIIKVFHRVFRELASLNRPSRQITMTTSAGKVTLLGTAVVNGETVFALQFNEGRNMEWMERVFLAKYDPRETRVDRLQPFDTDEFFYEAELRAIEQALAEIQQRKPTAEGRCVLEAVSPALAEGE